MRIFEVGPRLDEIERLSQERNKLFDSALELAARATRGIHLPNAHPSRIGHRYETDATLAVNTPVVEIYDTTTEGLFRSRFFLRIVQWPWTLPDQLEYSLHVIPQKAEDEKEIATLQLPSPDEQNATIIYDDIMGLPARADEDFEDLEAIEQAKLVDEETVLVLAGIALYMHGPHDTPLTRPESSVSLVWDDDGIRMPIFTT